jgi:hypothetical protein
MFAIHHCRLLVQKPSSQTKFPPMHFQDNGDVGDMPADGEGDDEEDPSTDDESDDDREGKRAPFDNVINGFVTQLQNHGAGVPVPDPATLSQISAYLQHSLQYKQPKRRYVSTTVSVRPPRIDGGVRPPKKHQARNGVVYAYEPTDDSCCEKQCFLQFHDATLDCIRLARAPLYDSNLSRATLGSQLRANHTLHLKLYTGVPCCVTMACRIYSASRQLLYKDNRITRTRADANHSNCKVSASVCAWLTSLKECLDVMPDEGGWYMCNHQKKTYVYKEYVEDVQLWPTLYLAVTRQWFTSVWRDNFPEIRLRKHCRFTKCYFCVKYRGLAADRTQAVAVREDAKSRLRQHYAWAHKRERGLYGHKTALAVTQPQAYISIAIDATDKFSEGFPHFVEKTKKDDIGVRLKVEIVCVIVHGAPPYIFLAWEHLRSDPNLVCEVLSRTLIAEEARRGKLPPTLFLQMDNCIRENKNTYTEKFLEWLVERGVSRKILASFLPVGHTHFDPDQLASRIGEILRTRDIHNAAALVATLKQCYSPAPHVEFIHDVLDWRNLINPGINTDYKTISKWPVGTALCRQNRGLCTKKENFDKRYYMPPTSDLHWMIRPDANGNVFLQTRHSVEEPDGQWGEPVFHWDTNAKRPRDRENKHRSGLLPSDLVFAPRRTLSAKRIAELTKTLAGASHRLSEQDANEIADVFHGLVNPPTDMALPDHRWTLKNEVPIDCVEPTFAPLRAAPYSIMHNDNEQRQAREQRNQGEDVAKLVLGKFVAYTTKYLKHEAQQSRNEFWLGRILNLDNVGCQLEVRCYHTGTKLNATGKGNTAKYRPWMGAMGTTYPQKVWIPYERILLQIDQLTVPGNRVAVGYRRRIVNVIGARVCDQQDMEPEYDKDDEVEAEEDEQEDDEQEDQQEEEEQEEEQEEEEKEEEEEHAVHGGRRSSKRLRAH